MLEVLIAITLFSIGILIFSSMFVSSFQHSNKQDNQLIAINLARQVASEWSSKSYSTLSEESDPNAMKGDITVNEHGYHWEISIEPPPQIDGTSPAQMLIIKVEITDQNSKQLLATVHSSVAP